MRNLFARALLTLAASLAITPAAAGQTTLDDAAFLELGRKYYDWFAGGQADSVLAHMAADARAQSGGIDGIRERMNEFMLRAGAETQFVEDRMTRRHGNPQYWREANYSGFADEPIVFRWVFNAAGEIIGIGMNPRSRAPAPDSLPSGND